jgi:hypothetical protein
MANITDILHRAAVTVMAGVTVYGSIVTVSLVRRRMALAKERKREAQLVSADSSGRE